MLDEFEAGTLGTVKANYVHPENRVEPAPAAEKRPTLLRSILLSLLGGVIGMTYGVAALSPTLGPGGWPSFISLLPLVVMLVALVTGYAGAMFFLCVEDEENA